jgi:7-carboxy-7-deazaguanine synthase
VNAAVDFLYPVNTIYYTIQGEGVYTGVPAIFIRLQGCAVGCPWCDTKETWEINPKLRVESIEEACKRAEHYTYATAAGIGDYILRVWPNARYVVITGGEPAQYLLKTLVDHLHRYGFHVAIETSGTEVGHIDAGFNWVCVSPKINMPGGKRLKEDAIASADEIKFVIGKQRDVDQLQDLLNTYPVKENVTICLQPLSQNEKATALCIRTAQERSWRLSIQMHKYINLP